MPDWSFGFFRRQRAGNRRADYSRHTTAAIEEKPVCPACVGPHHHESAREKSRRALSNCGRVVEGFESGSSNLDQQWRSSREQVSQTHGRIQTRDQRICNTHDAAAAPALFMGLGRSRFYCRRICNLGGYLLLAPHLPPAITLCARLV